MQIIVPDSIQELLESIPPSDLSEFCESMRQEKYQQIAGATTNEALTYIQNSVKLVNELEELLLSIRSNSNE